MSDSLLKQVGAQLKHHVKARDLQRAEETGQKLWFEAFRRLGNEQCCDLSGVVLEDMAFREKVLSYNQIDELCCRHEEDTPNSEGRDLPPVLYLDENGFHLIDGTNRINRFLQQKEHGSTLATIVVLKKTG